MDMLMDDQIVKMRPAGWRKLAQRLHARYRTPDLPSAARFLLAVSEADEDVARHLTVALGDGYVDLALVSADAVYRDGETEHLVQWVTQRDIELARRIGEIADAHGLRADPAAVSVVELGLDTAQAATIAPVWAALLTGDAAAQGHGSPSDEVRDPTGRVPNLWFGDGTQGQRFHVEVYVAPEVREDRLAAVVAAGGTVADDSEAPMLTVVADQDGNTGVLVVAEPPAG